MDRILSDEEIRHLVIRGLTGPTERDKQVKVGASDLGNGCDRCVARSLAGVHYESAMSRRTWMGGVIGTAIHKMMEPVAALVAGAKAERHVVFGHIIGYGDVGGTIDLDLILSILDYKGSTRKKIALLRAFMAIQQGLEVPLWVKQKDTAKYQGGYKLDIGGDAMVSLSYNEFQKEMAQMVHKVSSYYGQAQLYLRGCPDAQVASLVFIARDGNGWYEVADLPGYDDMTKQHDIFVLTFARNDEYAQSLMDRAQSLWDRIEADTYAGVGEFDMHPDCFSCMEIIRAEEREARDAEMAAGEPGEPVLVPMEVVA